MVGNSRLRPRSVLRATFFAIPQSQVESFDYAPDTLTYKLKLLAIRDVVVSKTHG